MPQETKTDAEKFKALAFANAESAPPEFYNDVNAAFPSNATKENILSQGLPALEAKYGDDVKPLREYIETYYGSAPQQTQAPREPDKKISKLQQQALFEQAANRENSIVTVPFPLSWAGCKALTRAYYDETGKLCAFLSHSDAFEGRGCAQYTQQATKIPLLKEYLVQGKKELVFFDELAPKHAHLKQELCGSFFIGTLSEFGTGMPHRVWSLAPVPLTPSLLQGVSIELDDFKLVGESKRIQSKLGFVLSNSAVLPLKYNFKNIFEAIPHISDIQTISFELIQDTIFKQFIHPKWFEELIFGWLFSASYGGLPADYPLHLFWLDEENGVGKTSFAINLLKALGYNPETEIWTATGSTWGDLIPSFAGDRARGGRLVEFDMIAAIDEFLRTKERNNFSGLKPEEKGKTFGLLNDLYGGREYWAGSAKGDRIKVKMSARALMLSNCEYGAKDFTGLIQKTDAPFICRNLIYFMLESHRDFLAKQRTRVTNPNYVFNNPVIPPREFNVLTRTLQSFKARSIDGDVTDAIAKEILEAVPDGVRRDVESRFPHHALCLADGVTKTRCLIEGAKSEDDFVFTDADAEKTKDLLNIVAGSWGLDEEGLKKLTPRSRRYHLGRFEGAVFDIIDEARRIKEPDIIEIAKARGEAGGFAPHSIPRIPETIVRLVGDGMIHENEGDEYSPYWYSGAKKE